MVVTKVLQIKTSKNLKRAIIYITQEAKTLKRDDGKKQDGFAYAYDLIGDQVYKKLVSGYDLTNVSDNQMTYDDFIITKKTVDAMRGNDDLSDIHNDGRVMAHHIIQSFSPSDNLTPEQVHEIGRQTALELTGGHHQFVIATHMDRGHLHNHIIFNTTDNVSLKKFRWQKGTKKSLEKISDKYAALQGAKILKPSLRNSYTNYSAWRQKNSYRVAIKERLDFLLQYATSLEDFKAKAQELQLNIDTSGKYVTYKLLDSEQKRSVRERTLSKKGKYGLERITERLSKNQVGYPVDEIAARFKQFQDEKSQDFEMKLAIDSWQVKYMTPQAIYVDVNFGIDRKGTVSIPARMLDQDDKGNFTAYLKKNDFFYFLNEDHSEQNHFIKGSTLIKQLSAKNGELILRKNKNISRLDRLVDELNFLLINGVTNSSQFELLQDRFDKQLVETDKELEKLDSKVHQVQELFGALVTYQTEPEQRETAAVILDRANVDKTSDPNLLKKEVEEIVLERDTLKEHRDAIVKDYTMYKELKAEQDKDLSSKSTLDNSLLNKQ
ncbi:putative relaxase [Streptococcus mutans 3SN1]|uniref:helical hairpin domain-containing protein n=1 Tax=Streptococcus mutans TaxID=1309 RepID=UPI0002B54DDF|nr:relaxase/mobilization nuclease domain-containing protein [Streptococcus mutans]EMB67380.1 putative relaxase [Streptococcus mutans 3SN1]